MNSPKAYLATATGDVYGKLQAAETPMTCKVSRNVVLIDSREGFFLLCPLSADLDQSYCVVPIYDEIIGNFTDDVKNWLKDREITVRRTRL